MRTPISNKTKIKEGIIAVLVICLIACTPIISYAAESKAAIPVRQELTGSGDAAFMYILTAEDPGCPLPADANDERYSFSLSGNNTKETAIEFNKVVIKNKAGDKPAEAVFKCELITEKVQGKSDLVNSGDGRQMTVWLILFLIAFISLLIWLIRLIR